MEHIFYASADGAATITLNRPEKRNALDEGMVRELHAALRAAESAPEVRVVVFAAAGSAFCAGADLAYLQRISRSDIAANRFDSHELMALLRGIASSAKPTVAVVRGPALAGGCGLTTACDITVASADATFGYPEVRIGFIPAIVLALLRGKIGDAAAKDLALRGRIIGAEEAQRMGLIVHVVPPDRLDDAAREIVEDLQRGAAAAQMLIKRMFLALPGMPPAAALEYAATMNAFARQTDDCKRGVEGFLRRRNRG